MQVLFIRLAELYMSTMLSLGVGSKFFSSFPTMEPLTFECERRWYMGIVRMRSGHHNVGTGPQNIYEYIVVFLAERGENSSGTISLSEQRYKLTVHTSVTNTRHLRGLHI